MCTHTHTHTGLARFNMSGSAECGSSCLWTSEPFGSCGFLHAASVHVAFMEHFSVVSALAHGFIITSLNKKGDLLIVLSRRHAANIRNQSRTEDKVLMVSDKRASLTDGAVLKTCRTVMYVIYTFITPSCRMAHCETPAGRYCSVQSVLYSLSPEVQW